MPDADTAEIVHLAGTLDVDVVVVPVDAFPAQPRALRPHAVTSFLEVA
jgi:hypothetical protein